MARSTQQAVRVGRVSFESTRLSPQGLAETYARIVPITRKVIGTGANAMPQAAPQPTTKERAEHG
jgi:hypothetical protein